MMVCKGFSWYFSTQKAIFFLLVVILKIAPPSDKILSYCKSPLLIENKMSLTFSILSGYYFLLIFYCTFNATRKLQQSSIIPMCVKKYHLRSFIILEKRVRYCTLDTPHCCFKINNWDLNICFELPLFWNKLFESVYAPSTYQVTDENLQYFQKMMSQ